MMQEDTRKGPWTEQEDFLLANVVDLFGDRRWDFVAKVSGLNRTGKSCRLRWVNYLHPGLKRGKMTSIEERLVLKLHEKWGNSLDLEAPILNYVELLTNFLHFSAPCLRWSRIARQLPGRTDNEIKNYWRTHMRKKAQERKRVDCLSNTSCDSSSSTSNHTQHSLCDIGTESVYDIGVTTVQLTGQKQRDEEGERICMDEIWKEIVVSKDTITPLNDGYDGGLSSYSCTPLVSPWEFCQDSLWKTHEEESKMPPPSNNYFQACCDSGRYTLTGS